MLKEKLMSEDWRYLYPNPLPIINTEEDQKEVMQQQIRRYKQKMKTKVSEIKEEKQPVSEKKPKGKIVIYTDGSCLGNPGRGGWAAVFEDKEISGGEKSTTNNRMELTAVIEALKATPQGSSIEVFTDSNYVKDGITSWIHNWKKNGWKTSNKKPVLNKDLWQALDSLKNKRNVKFNWVKGHAGNRLNERCDELAKNRAQSKNTEKIVVTKIGKEEIPNMTVKDFAEKISKDSLLFIEHDDRIFKFEGGQKIPNDINNLEVEEIRAECMHFLKVITKE